MEESVHAFTLNSAVAGRSDWIDQWGLSIPPQKTDRFMLISSEGAVHDAHFDPSGFHTMLRVDKGAKLVIYAVPLDGKASLTPYIDDHLDALRGPNLKIFRVVLEAGTTL